MNRVYNYTDQAIRFIANEKEYNLPAFWSMGTNSRINYIEFNGKKHDITKFNIVFGYSAADGTYLNNGKTWSKLQDMDSDIIHVNEIIPDPDIDIMEHLPLIGYGYSALIEDPSGEILGSHSYKPLAVVILVILFVIIASTILIVVIYEIKNKRK